MVLEGENTLINKLKNLIKYVFFYKNILNKETLIYIDNNQNTTNYMIRHERELCLVLSFKGLSQYITTKSLIVAGRLQL